MRSKIEAHQREIRFVQSLLPITSIVLETGTFDPHALKHPEVLHRKKLLIPYGDEVKQMFEDIAGRSDFAFEATFDRSRPHSLSGEE